MVGPQTFSIAERGDSCVDAELNIPRSTIMNSKPHGVTPLLQHVKEIRKRIASLGPMLRETGTKVAIIIATDGLPSDQHGMSAQSSKSLLTLCDLWKPCPCGW